MKSKEDELFNLFFNEPTREWHFEEVVKESGVTRSKVDKWLKKFINEKLIKRIKEKGKMPYYIADHQSLFYRNRKRLFALKKLYDSGLLNHLSSLEKARTVIIFGSFVRWDWYKSSDVDIFIYGDSEGLSIAKYELKLNRNIQLFICKDNKELSRLGEGLIKNIIKGDIIKGDLDFLKVKLNA